MGAVAEPFRPPPATWQQVAHPDDVYPSRALEGCQTALVGFCARWYGRQDAFFVAEAGLTATCVDIDGPRLDAMRDIYPSGWEFVQDDVFQFAKDSASQPFKWDVVSLDEFTRDFERCADNIRLWCSIARKAVILGTGPNTEINPPDGWAITDVMKRSDYDQGVFWAVVQPK